MGTETDKATHVLVVEDEEAVRRTMVRNLEQRGYRVSEARTVAWALALCRDERPDVIVLDINLPDGAGWDVLRGLAAASIAQPPIVAISAIPPASSRLNEFAPIRFLPKPFLIDALLRAVERSVGREQGYEELDRTPL